MAPHIPCVYRINISTGGVPKHPVPEAWISVHGVAGDCQRNRILHGGADRAVCLFSRERIEALIQEGHPIAPGACGENLTLQGVDWAHLAPGDRLRIGDTLELEITRYTEPCRKNARWFREEHYRRIDHRIYPGWSRLYARVLVEGMVRVGDPVWVKPRVTQE
ncbi:MAG: MOSC domain-containing protein [Nitrospirae bacterium]|nr:MAG: MOSC domain-containing protein [Nitrospirota bacterium]